MAALVVAGALAYMDRMVWIFVLIYSVVLVVALAAAWSWWCGRHLRLIRESEEGPKVVGQQLVERFILQNDSGLPIRSVEVRDHSLAGGARAARVVSLAPRQIVTWEVSRRLSSRGRFPLGPTELRMADPCGLFQRRLRWPSAGMIIVHPPLVAIPARSLPGAADPQPGRRRPGGRARSQDLLILLDLCRFSHRGEGAESTLEYAVTVAASIAQAAAAQGRAVALSASAEPRVRIPAGRGEIHDRNLLDYLAVATAQGRVRFPRLVLDEMTPWQGRGGVVLITADPTQDWVAAAAAAAAPGQRPLAVLLDPAGLSSGGSVQVPARWRLVLDLWVVRHGDDLARLDTLHGQAVV